MARSRYWYRLIFFHANYGWLEDDVLYYSYDEAYRSGFAATANPDNLIMDFTVNPVRR